MTEHADILGIVGIDNSTFYGSGQDVSLKDEDSQQVARVFRRGGKLVYRAGEPVEWSDRTQDRRDH